MDFKVVDGMGKYVSKIDKNVFKNKLKALLISTRSYIFFHDSLDNVSKNVKIKPLVIRQVLLALLVKTLLKIRCFVS
jgi:hypothetical protein